MAYGARTALIVVDHPDDKIERNVTMKRIVVAIDNSPGSMAALRWAYDEAAQDGHQLVALHVIDIGRGDGNARRKTASDIERESLASVESIIARMPDHDPDVRVTVTIAQGPIVECVLDAATDAATVVLGEPQCVEHASLPQQLARACACPVVQVSPDGHRTAVPDASEGGLLGVPG